ncbi:hypothetical protein Cgig2_018740 [Carnegiea gigantea]|uniref:Uncharacterized protein n=1 Tax=Carnegiea gigantea TaxID=171969 RepID=A0A9Q1JHV2_9CARY|nr:hypothetical protein Cgig2_018740 [Carnegiea gigantea]
MGGHQVGPAHSPPLVIEHAPSAQMPAVDRVTNNPVVASIGPSDDATTLDTLPVPEIRADAQVSRPTNAVALGNETTEELVIQGESTTVRPQRHRRPPARLRYYNQRRKQGFCSACQSGDNVSTIAFPYAYKLLFQELQAMNIVPCLRFPSTGGIKDGLKALISAT